MMVDIIITHRGAPGFSASAVRNPLVKAEPSTQNEAAAKNDFQPSFWSRGQNLFSKSESPPWVGVASLRASPTSAGAYHEQHLWLRHAPSTKLPCDALHRAGPDAERLGYLQHTHPFPK